MALGNEHYGTYAEAQDYFSSRLHEWAWSNASVQDRNNSLIAASRVIDYLNFKGNKNTVWQMLTDKGCSTDASTALNNGCISISDLQQANLQQALEFPRGQDTEVPEAIRQACYELCHSLLDGKDPELELENLGVVSQGYGSVRTSYSRTHIPIEHLINMVPSALAWRLLKPFIRDNNAIKLRRIN